MAYTPTEWACSDIVTAEKLNAMERGVADMNTEYVPNEWKCGDVVSAEKLNHIEQGIANGCGGSSDFSTARVTIVNNHSGQPNVDAIGLPVCVAEGGMSAIMAVTSGINTGASVQLNVPLYQGNCFWMTAYFDSYYRNMTFTASGDASIIGAGILITGDCTITIS